MTSHPQAEIPFRVSTYCNNGSCVSVGMHDGRIYVRDTKETNGPILGFSPAEWTEFLSSVK